MHTAQPAPIGAASTTPNARIVGVVYLLFFLTAFAAMFLTRGLVSPGDVAATTNSIRTHEALYRSGFVLDLVSNALYVALTALLYFLLEPVNRRVALLAAFFSLVGCAVQILGGLFRLAPLVILGDNPWVTALTMEQRQAAALLCLALHAQTFNISLVLFAVFDVLIGWLIFRSTFLPRILGALMMIAGVGWLTFAWPPLATSLSSFILPFGAFAEILLMLWLLVRGVDVPRWQEQAGIVSEESR